MSINILNDILGPLLSSSYISRSSLELLQLSCEERDRVMAEIAEKLTSILPVSGPQRNEHWNSCWSGLFSQKVFVSDPIKISDFYPPYFKEGHMIFRATKFGDSNGDWYKTTDPHFEPNFLHILKHIIIQYFNNNIDTICEVGCGSCWNALDFWNIDHSLKYLALDWAYSVNEIVFKLQSSFPNQSIEFQRFDMFNPNFTLSLSKSSCLFTSTAMEQTGLNWEMFLRWMLSQPCRLFAHIEPLYELYGDTPFDRFGKAYHNKRGYMRGFLPALQRLEKDGRIKILLLQKTIGCKYNDNLDLLIWQKND